MKKLLALCLTVMLVVAMVPVIGVAAADTVTLSVGNGTANPGETVAIAVSIANNTETGLSSAKFNIAYDATVLEIVPYVDEEGNEYEAQNLNHGGIEAQFSPIDENPFIVNWAHGTKKTTKEGDVAIITFKVKDDAAVGTYDLTVTVDPADVFVAVKPDTIAVDYTVVNGSVTVVCEHENTEKIAAVDPTCTEPGLTEGSKCTYCGEVVVAQEAVDALGHTEELVDAKAHTATEDGFTGNVVCSVCEEVIKAGEVIPAGHVAVAVEAKDATCEDAGNIAHWGCELCDNIFGAETVTDDDIIAAEDVVIDALGHKYGDWKVTKEATATEKGSKEKVCSVCGDKVVEEIAALGAPAADDNNKEENNKTDDNKTSPDTADVANIYVVVAMLVAIAAASVVVLKKKA